MKRTKWFPFNKGVTLFIYIGALFAYFFILSFSIWTIFDRNLTNFLITFTFFVIIFLLLNIGNELMPLNIKIKKNKIVLNLGLIRKRVVSLDCNIAFTQFIYYIGPYARNRPTFRDYDIERSNNSKKELINNFTFVIFNGNNFIDKIYLRDENGELFYRQESINYFVKTIDNKNNIIIDGTYSNYKYLRQFFDVARFRDTRGIEQDMIAEYEAKLQQENEAKSVKKL